MGRSLAPRVYILIAGVLLTGISFVVGIDPTTAYTVNFAQPGGECRNLDLNIDARTGETLRCFGRDGSRRDLPSFTAEEKDRVYTLAAQLGGDADGLTADDRSRIESVVHEITAAKGDPGDLGNQTGPLGKYLFVIGVSLTILAGFHVLGRGLGDPGSRGPGAVR
jgi:hypothetical protein